MNYWKEEMEVKINVLNLEEDENGVTELKRDDEVVGRFVISDNGVEELYKFSEEELTALERVYTKREIDMLSLKLVRYFKENPETEGAEVTVTWKDTGIPDENELVTYVVNRNKK
jgi:hypothetical protein